MKKLFSLLFLFLLGFIFLKSPPSQLTNWQKIKEKGYLTWITRPSLLTYYSGLDGVMGLEYEIISQFCKQHELKLKINIAKSNNKLFEKFTEEGIDIAGGYLSLTKQRKKLYKASIDYDETFTSIVSSLKKPKIAKIENLSLFKGVVLKSSSYEELSKTLSNDNNAEILVVEDRSLFELLQEVTKNTYDYTLADVNLVSIFKSYIPQLRIGLKVSNLYKIVFLMQRNEDDSLKNELNLFLFEYKANGKVNAYKDLIVKKLPNSKPADTVSFLKNYSKRWSGIRPLVYEIANKYDINPVFLGALSYQESHWNPNAISPTLVKGLMMLTKDVAKEQNVLDRLNPRQSLEGGVRHFQKMMKKVPKRIAKPDQINFALASYNIGFGNLEKARIITQKAGRNPDLWSHVKKFLPELNKLEVNKADGKTAVRYVENIHIYQNLLQWKEQQEQTLLTN